MTGLPKGARFRAAIGLIAAYAIALQTIFAAFAPLPANAHGADFAGWHVLCFGSGNTAAPTERDPSAPAPASGKFHCVLCGLAQAFAIVPEQAANLARPHIVSFIAFAAVPERAPVQHAVRTGSARAPPLTA